MIKDEYLNDSYKAAASSFIDAVTVFRGKTAIALSENIFHPSGGGQPSDHGNVLIRNVSYRVEKLMQKNGQVFLVFDSEIAFSDELWGEEVYCTIDWERRYHLMRFHTCAHVLMASAAQTVEGFNPKGMLIQNNLSGCTIRFSAAEPIYEQRLLEIQKIAQSAIAEDLSVGTMEYTSFEAANLANRNIFRVDPDLNLSGKIRVVIIHNFDANPCSGTHLKSLGEIGNFKIQNYSNLDKSNECAIDFLVSESATT
jgi:Ser-tRNA(Ala) deacylase AlaX